MPHIASLVDAYAASDIATAIRTDIRAVAQPGQGPEGSEELPDVAVESTLLRGRKRATWATQFRILSGRAFKNMYRDPALLTFQYSASIVAACERSRIFVGSLGTESRRHCSALWTVLSQRVRRYWRIPESIGCVSQLLTGKRSTDFVFVGAFFFTLALFGFSCLSSLGLFANERILFMRERCDLIFMAAIN
jgi:hypothetical protein